MVVEVVVEVVVVVVVVVVAAAAATATDMGGPVAAMVSRRRPVMMRALGCRSGSGYGWILRSEGQRPSLLASPYSSQGPYDPRPQRGPGRDQRDGVGWSGELKSRAQEGRSGLRIGLASRRRTWMDRCRCMSAAVPCW